MVEQPQFAADCLVKHSQRHRKEKWNSIFSICMGLGSGLSEIFGNGYCVLPDWGIYLTDCTRGCPLLFHKLATPLDFWRLNVNGCYFDEIWNPRLKVFVSSLVLTKWFNTPLLSPHKFQFSLLLTCTCCCDMKENQFMPIHISL